MRFLHALSVFCGRGVSRHLSSATLARFEMELILGIQACVMDRGSESRQRSYKHEDEKRREVFHKI